MRDYKVRLVNDLTVTIFKAMDISDGLDSTSAAKYAEAAAKDAVEWAMRLVVSYEPLAGSAVFDLAEALKSGVFYDEIEG